jgi:CubicO group peptidase (beta-lactamase class C family)
MTLARAAGCLAASLMASSVWPADPTRAVDGLFSTLVRPGGPGAAVLVRMDGRTVAARGYGVRDLRTRSPIDARTSFRLASCSKQFTAMAAMLLARDGKLRYEDRLTSILPGLPAAFDGVTVRHLLTHTSGLPDYETLMDEHEKAHGSTWTSTRQIRDREVLELLRRAPAPLFAPGARWSYSNTGYVLLGLIVAQASGEPFGRFLEHRIFRPLKMRSTLAFEAGMNSIPRRAYGHSRRGGTLVETDQSPTSATLGDGGIYSNLEDLARWDAGLDSGSLLDPRLMREALEPARLAGGAATRWPDAPGGDNLAPGRPVSYGFGWFLDPFEGRPRMWHSGSTRGFSTAVERFPERRLTVVVLANRTDLDAPALALRLAAELLD